MFARWNISVGLHFSITHTFKNLIVSEYNRVNALEITNLKKINFKKKFLLRDLSEIKLQKMNKQFYLLKDKFKNKLKCIITKSKRLGIVLKVKHEEKTAKNKP